MYLYMSLKEYFMSNNEILKLFKQHQNLAADPLPYEKWLVNYKNNLLIKQKEKPNKPAPQNTKKLEVNSKTKTVRIYKGPFPLYVNCNECEELKHKDEYYKTKSRRGHRLTCKVCMSSENAKKYEEKKLESKT